MATGTATVPGREDGPHAPVPVVGARDRTHERAAPSEGRADALPDWRAVEELLERLAATRATFPTATSSSNWISVYEPGLRLRLETEVSSRWVQTDCVKACWQTFERLGRVRRQDLLEPGRCSAFMMGLFQQVAGVREEPGEEARLVLPRRERCAERARPDGRLAHR